MNARLHVLFICALNKWRSPTAERLYQNDARLAVRSAGIRSEARRHLSQKDLEWADVIFVMEREQKSWIQARFRELSLPEIQVLNIPVDLEFMDPELQRLLRLSIDPEIEELLRERASRLEDEV